MKIGKNLNRLSLHDARFENAVRVYDTLTLTFDWAKLESAVELGIVEGVILGQTVLQIIGVRNEKLKAYSDDKNYTLIDVPNNISSYWSEIGTTEINDENKTLQLGGFLEKEGNYFWSEWSLNYESCEIEWNSYVTVAEWEKGKLATD